MKDLLKDVAAWFFVAGSIFLCCALFLSTLSREACGPAAHPAPATMSYLTSLPPSDTPAPSEQAGQGPVLDGTDQPFELTDEDMAEVDAIIARERQA